MSRERVVLQPPVGRRLVSCRVTRDGDGTWRWMVSVDFVTRHGWEASSFAAWRALGAAMSALESATGGTHAA